MAENGILDYQGMNQAIYRGATSNIVVDTQSMSIEIGAGNTSHTSNLHFECNHDANVASIKLHSNVTTEFSRSKKLIKYPRVAMTQNDESGTSGYVTSASSQESTNRQAWKVFNNTYAEGDGWRSAQSYASDGSFTGTFVDFSSGGQTFIAADKGEWLKITLPEKMRLERFRLQPRYSPTTGGATYSYGRSEFVKNGAIWGSNDGSSWDKVYTITHGVPATDTTITEFTVPISTTTYNNFVLVVTDTHGSSAGLRTSFSEWELLGVPEYDPDAHGTDVVVKSVVNVPNTDWLEVYYDAKDLADGAISTTAGAITGLGGTTNNGTAHNGVTVSDGAFVFDGTNDYITTSALGFSGDQVHSVSIWFRSDRPQTDMTTENSIYSFGYGNNLRAGLSWWSPVTRPDSPLRFWHSGYGGKDFPGTTFLEGMWNHVVVVYPGNGANNIRIWLNGVERMGVNTGTNSAFNWSASDNVSIGDWYSATGIYGQSPWDGKIANFRLFNRAITFDEIYQLYAYQKEYFGHGDLSMTLKAGRLGIGTSEPRAALDINFGGVRLNQELWVGSTKINNTVRVSTNTLSFYEEGSWTPVLGAVATPTYTEQFGYYTRIGNIVHLTFRITVSGLDNGDGSGIHISLPYELNNNNGHSAMCVFGYNNSLFDPNRSNGGANIGNGWIIPAQGGSGQTAVAVRYNNCWTSGTLLGFATYSLQVTK